MVNIYKIGGNVINNPENLREFLKDFSSIKEPKILVHGGGKEATELGAKMGLEAKMIDGRRVTDKSTLDIVTMVYAGLINKRIVSELQMFNCNAVGLSGADAHVIPAKRRNPEPIDFGFVGDINPKDINVDFINLLLENGITPVFCAICMNTEGGLLNCNADTIAGSLAIACSSITPTNLIYCFEKKGVLSNVEDENSVIPLITPEIFETMVSAGKISGGMLPKVTNALQAVEKGVKSVRIRYSGNIAQDSGTLIRQN